jgi:hypothetical protein
MNQNFTQHHVPSDPLVGRGTVLRTASDAFDKICPTIGALSVDHPIEVATQRRHSIAKRYTEPGMGAGFAHDEVYGQIARGPALAKRRGVGAEFTKQIAQCSSLRFF